MATLFVPFNFNPANTVQGNGASSTYTVPADYHTEITVTLSANAHHALLKANTGTSLFAGYTVSDTKALTQKFWLKSGDVVTFTADADDDSDISVTTGSTDTSTMTVVMKVNTFVMFRAKASVTTKPDGVAGATVRKKTYSDISWHAAEFFHA